MCSWLFLQDRAEMYVGDDVSPDFYAWVFPKCDHVAVGTGTVVDKKGIQRRGRKDEKGMSFESVHGIAMSIGIFADTVRFHWFSVVFYSSCSLAEVSAGHS